MKLRILGCGTSSGVPRIGGADGRGDWGDCDPGDPRNRRTRASILVATPQSRVLVDTSPDLREQLIAGGIDDVDAVIWTHDHADHCHGIDDLRQLYQKRNAPVRGYARPETFSGLTARFEYVFAGKNGYPAAASIALLPDQMEVGDLQISVVDQPHGSITSAGLVFHHAERRIAYSTDFNAMTDEMRIAFHAVDVWVVDALRRRPHPTHPTLADALRWRTELKVGRTVLVHMDWSMDYATLAAELPDDVAPGYDGMEICL